MTSSRERIDPAAETVARHAADLLAQRRDGEACEAVCRRTVDVIEAKVEALKADNAAIACAPGCVFCCHLRVGVFAHEAMALLNYLRTTLPGDEAATIEARILENARRIDDMTVAEHYAARIPCALLVDGRCAAYDVRPSACARYHSMSRSRCEYSFDHPQQVGTPSNSRPALLELQAFGAAVVAATGKALTHAGLSTSTAELHQRLRTLIEDPTATDRWPS